MIRNASSWRLSFSYYQHTSSIIHWFWGFLICDMIVVELIVKRSISSMYLFSSVDTRQITFKRFDHSLKSDNQFEYGQFDKLTAHDPLSLLFWFCPFDFQSSWRILYSYTFRYPLFDDVFICITVFRIWYRRVHFVRFLPTYIMIIFLHSVPTSPTSIISSRPLTSINTMSFLRTPL